MSLRRALLLGVLAALTGLGSACALTYHTAPAYRYDPPAADLLERRAARVCSESAEPPRLPERRFLTDGCSMWPDGVWQKCCVSHDIAYWCGGSREQRRRADLELRSCVKDEYNGFMAGWMWTGVRAGGPPWVPARWRWGYGHRYPAGYGGQKETARSDPGTSPPHW